VLVEDEADAGKGALNEKVDVDGGLQDAVAAAVVVVDSDFSMMCTLCEVQKNYNVRGREMKRG
jgi:hypothetical protein